MNKFDLDELLKPSFIEEVISDAYQLDKELLYADLKEQSFRKNEKGNLYLDDGILANLYYKYNEMVYANGAFYSPDGMKRVGLIEHEVQETIRQILTVNLARNTSKAVDALKLIAYKDEFDFTDKLLIPFSNGDMTVNLRGNWVFNFEGKQPVPYRLPIAYKPLRLYTPTPNFDKWLNDLFYPEDIITLQEYLGYCLLPTTRGQKILLIIGEAGCGKSVIIDILSAIFGGTITAPLDLKQFFDDKFKVAELENQLVFYEDDINDQKLDDSTKFKKLATGGVPITADRKFAQPFKFVPYCKFIMCGNHMLKCPSDKSDGFYRRLLPLPTKPKDPTRKKIAHFGSIVATEAVGIVQWMLKGLKRLIDNDWEFTISDRSKEYVEDFKELSDHLPAFMRDCFVRDEKGNFTNDELRTAYSMWCIKNGVKPLIPKTVNEWMFDKLGTYGLKIERNGNIIRPDGRKRGYRGGYIKDECLKSDTIPLK